MKDRQIILWQRIEGLAIFVTAVSWYVKNYHFQSIGLVIFLFVAPDIAILGYMISNKIGAFLYNLTHSMVIPLLLLCIWLVSPSRIIIFAVLAGLTHVGMDRALGFGLKYNDGFKHTHLGFIGNKK